MSNKVPENLFYTDEHEWVQIDGDTATIGITDFAQSSLGDIVFVELPDTDSELDKGATFGVVESIKSVSDLYVPLSGKVVEKNDDVEETPESINSDPYSSWLVKIKLTDTSQVESLMNAKKYSEFCESN